MVMAPARGADGVSRPEIGRPRRPFDWLCVRNRIERAGHKRDKKVNVRVVVVGGGILGLATARLLTTSSSGDDVVVLEKESALARHQTGHNSGVVHAGLYYAPGSLKARLCTRGRELMRDFCAGRAWPTTSAGRWSSPPVPTRWSPCAGSHERAATNGVPGPAVAGAGGAGRGGTPRSGVAGLHSPHTAIVDFVAVASAMAADVRAAGGVIRTGRAGGPDRPRRRTRRGSSCARRRECWRQTA